MFKWLLPKDTRYKGLNQIVIEKKPHKRTIFSQSLVDGNAKVDGHVRISLPYTIFILTYIPVGIWPLRFLVFHRLQVAFRDKPLSEDDTILYRAPFTGSTIGPSPMGVCLGTGYHIRCYLTLNKMVSDVVGRYWQTPFWSFLEYGLYERYGLNYIPDLRHESNSTLEKWHESTKKDSNYIFKANQTADIGYLPSYLSCGSWWRQFGRFFKEE